MVTTTIVLSHDGRSLAECSAAGRVSILIRVPPRMAEAAFEDTRIGPFLDAGAAVILAFSREVDALQFQRLLDRARVRH